MCVCECVFSLYSPDSATYSFFWNPDSEGDNTQVVVIVGLAEVRSQIDTHLLCQSLTILLGALRAMLDSLPSDQIVKFNVNVRILETERFLKCPFNRNVSKLMALLFGAGFVVVMAEAMPSTFDFDWRWVPKCHR